METNFKGTTGILLDCTKNAIGNYPSFLPIRRADDGVLVALVNHSSGEIHIREYDANANLIADAFNVRQQINVDLPELLKQRDELLKVVKHLLSLKHVKDLDGETPYYLEAMPKAWDKAKDLITKIEQK